MPNEQDPRNIFVNQRQQYSEMQHPTDTSNGANTANTANSAPHNAQQSSAQSEYEQKVAEMKRLAAKYEREGEGQLVKDIVNNVIEQKARGTLSNEQLVAFANRISPLLNAEQRSRLEGLVEQLLKL